jgi:hypothetical protein
MVSPLDGQLIGAIREVWFAAKDAPFAGPAALEIETKAGRYVHLAPTRDRTAIRIGPGPFTEPENRAAGRATQRCWRDLTTSVPDAFDGRPRVTALLPIDLVDGHDPAPAAREWCIILDSGTALRCQLTNEGFELHSSKE